jgi:type I restriction enzyme S subunit
MGDRASIRLSDACSKVGSGSTPRGGKDAYRGGRTALIRSQNIYNDGFHREGIVHIDDDQAADLAGVEVLEHDVLLNITGDSVARCAQVDARLLPARVNQHVLIIRPRSDELDPRFLRYSIVNPRMQAHLLAMASSGATRNALTKAMVENLQIEAPSITEQRAIAHILGTLDDKIDLNRRTNETLEAMARALFKSWFVDFDPVRAKAAGRKPSGMDAGTAELFPSEFGESELGALPLGWNASTLGTEVARCGGTIQTGPFGSQLHASDYLPAGVPVVMPKDISGRRVSTASIARVGENDAQRLARHRLQLGDVVYSRRGDVERHALISQREVGWLCGTGCLLVRLGHRWRSPAFASFALDRPETRAWIVQHAIGATMPNLNTGILSSVPIVMPPDDVLTAFAIAVDQLQDLVVVRDAESSMLAALRDTILPRLLSGELRIPDAERIVEAAT